MNNIGELGIGFRNKRSTAETRTGESDWSILLGDQMVRNNVLHNIGELGKGLLKQRPYGGDANGQVRLEHLTRE